MAATNPGFRLSLGQGSVNDDHYPLLPNTCRVLGREMDSSYTVQLQVTGHRALSSEQVDLVDTCLKRYLASPGKDQLTSFHREDDVLFDDPAISKVHAMVFCDEEGIGIIDLASTNGTFVNGERVSVQRLQTGDELRLGTRVLRLESTDSD